MPELSHLPLPRAEIDMERRKRQGFGNPPRIDVGEQSVRVRQAVDEVLENHARLRTDYVNPALIVRVRTSGIVSEEEWIRAGLTVLGHDENNALVLFDRASDLAAFRTRVDAYAAGPLAGRQIPLIMR